ncbi:MAG TPA: DUF72 domain-containing protein [Gemmatimonadaceae bacterium]|nr:DUF72 domain-containing protein [Gemmatimonadaceae bacterium]
MKNQKRRGRSRIGISGYIYPPWRGSFYPDDLPARRWLEYASRCFNSIEINGTFYSLKSPSVFERWINETPDDFLFALKGSRFITHNLKLRNCDEAMGNFFASGILLLGEKTGPFLWQLPATYSFDPERMNSFMDSLPRSSREAESVARRHDYRLRRGACTEASADVPYRHAFEVRHPSYFSDEFYSILEKQKCGFVIADTAGQFPYSEAITADFVYVRLHGSKIIYASGYSDTELKTWARKISKWRNQQHDVYVYFDNDVKTYAPFDAMRLEKLVTKP